MLSPFVIWVIFFSFGRSSMFLCRANTPFQLLMCMVVSEMYSLFRNYSAPTPFPLMVRMVIFKSIFNTQEPYRTITDTYHLCSNQTAPGVIKVTFFMFLFPSSTFIFPSFLLCFFPSKCLTCVDCNTNYQPKSFL